MQTYHADMRLAELPKGTVVARTGTDAWIGDLSRSLWTHVGLVVGDGEIVDANDSPKSRKRGKAVAKVPIMDFFSRGNAPGGGGGFEFIGKIEHVRVAVRWAWLQARRRTRFDIFLDVLDESIDVLTPTPFYCSHFIWRAYRQADVTLVPLSDFFDFRKTAEDLATAIDTLAKVAKRDHFWAKRLPIAFIRQLIREKLSNHSGLYLTPGQLTQSAYLKRLQIEELGA